MTNLTATSPCNGLLPLEIGGVSIVEAMPGAITSLMPYRGREKELSEALKTAHGMAWPAPGRATGKEGARAVWTGKGQAMLLGPAPDPGLAHYAALTDQSDAWAVVRVSGADVEAVLARLVPIDLRAQLFKRGHATRTQLQHMTVSIARISETTVQIMAFRSMAGTLIHDLESAAEGVAARAAL